MRVVPGLAVCGLLVTGPVGARAQVPVPAPPAEPPARVAQSVAGQAQGGAAAPLVSLERLKRRLREPPPILRDAGDADQLVFRAEVVGRRFEMPTLADSLRAETGLGLFPCGYRHAHNEFLRSVPGGVPGRVYRGPIGPDLLAIGNAVASGIRTLARRAEVKRTRAQIVEELAEIARARAAAGLPPESPR